MAYEFAHKTGYLVCFDVPFGEPRPESPPEVEKFSYAAHYLGGADEVEARQTRHGRCGGAKLLAHVHRAGIGWTVTRVWEDFSRDDECRLKAPGGSHWCPRCQCERVMARDPVYREVITQARSRFWVTIGAARNDRLHAASKGAGTRAWNRAAQTAREQLRAERRQAAADWVAAHPGSGLRHASLACVLEDKPVTGLSVSARRAAAYREQEARDVADGKLTDPADPWAPPTGPDIEAA